MDDNTTIINKDQPPTIPPLVESDDKTKQATSQLMSVSVRGWLTLITVLTVCFMEIFKIGVSEPLYSMSLIMVGFYFGQNKAVVPVPPTS